MDNTLPSKNLYNLKKILGKKIISVKRKLFQDDMDLVDYELNADGPVEFTFNDSSIVHFIADTVADSIGVSLGQMPRYGDSYISKDISNNIFWNGRIDREILQLNLLKSTDYSADYPSEFGIELLFDNGKKVLIEYKNEEDYPDMVMVASSYKGEPCIVKELINVKGD